MVDNLKRFDHFFFLLVVVMRRLREFITIIFISHVNVSNKKDFYYDALKIQVDAEH